MKIVLAFAASLAAALPALAGDASPAATPLWGVPLSRLNATRERPLFTPSRRPPEPAELAAPAPPSAPAPVVAAAPATPPFELVGAILGGGGAIALLRNPGDNAIIRVRANEVKDGWRAVTVSARSVLLEGQSGQFTLNMFKPGAAPPPPPPADAAVAVDTGDVGMKTPASRRGD